jgi:phage terminase large subunit-like protein
VSDLESFASWAARLTLDNGKPFELEPFQRSFLEDVFSGYPECWFVVPEGNGKTTLLAAFLLYHADTTPEAAVAVAAASRDQAMVLYRQARGFTLRNKLKQFVCHNGLRRIVHSGNDALIQIFAADASTGDGIIPTLCVIDEPHRHKNLELYLTWSGKLDKRDSQLIAISTAGEPGSEFEEARERIRQSATEIVRDGAHVRALGPGTALHEWALPEDGDPTDMHQVKAANPFSGMTVDKLAAKRERPTMTETHWRRFTCNMPTRSDLAAIAEREWFEAGEAVIPAGEEIWAGLDCGWRWDTTALVPYWMPEPVNRVLGPATILVPPRDGTSLDIFKIEHALAALHDRNAIHTLVMDISDARDVAEWAQQELGCEVVERGTGLPGQVLDYERFMEALRNGWLHHCDDPGLTRHVLNAVSRILPRGDAVFARPAEARRAQGQDRRVIDALVAAAMVHSVAVAALDVEPETAPLVAVA